MVPERPLEGSDIKKTKCVTWSALYNRDQTGNEALRAPKSA